MAAENEIAYEYSLVTLDLSQAQAIQDLIAVLRQESDTMEIAEVRDSLIDPDIYEDNLRGKDLPQRTWLVWAESPAGADGPKVAGPVGMGSILDGEVGVAILADFQNQGLGRLTLEAMIDWAKKVGYDNIWLDVDEANAPARHLYKAVGFVEVGEETQPIQLSSGRQANLMKMELLLS